jgi:group II intron reverse transcriptase/maturase
LGIPVVADRVVQSAMKIVLEPLFEADFKPCSFGARPRRSAHDANEVIRQTANRGRNWVVDADIRDYFTSIDQVKLMMLVEKRVSDRRMLKLIRKFLRAGVLEGGELRSTTTGTPQGGVLSPLLANIYLNYLDRIWEERCEKVGVLVRYMDDFVVLCRNHVEAEEALRRVSLITERMGLELHPDKTAIRDLKNGKEGFEFLGFHHRKMRSWKNNRYYLMRWPGKKAIKAFRERIRSIVGTKRQRLHRTLETVIEELNPVLRGWGNYFGVGNSFRALNTLDSYVTEKLCLFLSKKQDKSGRGWGVRWKGMDFYGKGLCQLSGMRRWHQYPVNASGRRASESRVR